MRYDITIILDLDHTLIHSVKRKKNRVVPTYQMVSCSYDVHHRPDLESFLEFCFRTFRRVVVWTAAALRYAEEIVQRLPVPEGAQFTRIVTRETFNTTQKDPSLLMTSPEFFGKMTFFVDDRPDVVAPYGSVHVFPVKQFRCGELDTDLTRVCEDIQIKILSVQEKRKRRIKQRFERIKKELQSVERLIDWDDFV